MNCKNILVLFLHSIFNGIFPLMVHAQSLEWACGIGGNATDMAIELALDNQGNVYCTGLFSDTVDFDPGENEFNLTSAGLTDVFVVKLNPSGELLWAIKFGGLDYDEPFDIEMGESGNLIVVGSFGSICDFDPGVDVFELTSSGYADGFIVKLDIDGNFIWAKTIGGTDYDYIRSVQVTSNSICLAGGFWGMCDFDPGPDIFELESNGSKDCFVVKLGFNGDFIWAKSFGSSYIFSGDESRTLDADNEENVYVGGLFSETVDLDPGSGVYMATASNSKYPDAYILKLNTDGNFQWARTYGGPGGGQCNSLIVCNNGDIVATGDLYGIADFDPNEAEYLVGSSGISSFIVRLSPAGQLIWARGIGGELGALGYSIAEDVSGDIYNSGGFYQTVDFDPGIGLFELSSVGLIDAFMSKLNSAGEFQWAVAMGSAEEDISSAIALDPWENIYTVGIFEEIIDFDPTEVSVLEAAHNGYDAFIHKMSQPVSVANHEHIEELTIYPNPSAGLIYVQADHKISLNYSIMDMSSRTLETGFIDEELWKLDMSEFSNGVYFVSLGERVYKVCIRR